MNTLSPVKKPWIIMGVLNATPDSFYDGGRHYSTADACAHAEKIAREGADIIDIGGESTRPAAKPVSEEEEIRRVVPVIRHIAANLDTPVSIDTTKHRVAREALDAGAAWINDISAGRLDPEMPALAALYNCPVLLMHSRETPQTMQKNPSYINVITEIIAELQNSIEQFIRKGVNAGNIIIDPGIGFAKRFEDNITLLNRLDEIAALKYPLAIGTSRKSFIGHITGQEPDSRLAGSLATLASAYRCGARIFRVHDVAETVDFLKVLSVIEMA
ncbi:MAG: dihydropteroate synthase [Chitinivibrionales bacterium]|nr:dihydropteroate synthase [Chitinivibrionales bacterium]